MTGDSSAVHVSTRRCVARCVRPVANVLARGSGSGETLSANFGCPVAMHQASARRDVLLLHSTGSTAWRSLPHHPHRR